MPELRIKRIYEEAAEEDGYRILVDRLWPRGIPEFQSRYIDELTNNIEAAAFRKTVYEKLQQDNVTLLFSAKDETMNNAAVLKDWLDEEKK